MRPSSRRRRSTSSRTSCWWPTSRAVVGSSSISSDGFLGEGAGEHGALALPARQRVAACVRPDRRGGAARWRDRRPRSRRRAPNRAEPGAASGRAARSARRSSPVAARVAGARGPRAGRVPCGRRSSRGRPSSSIRPRRAATPPRARSNVDFPAPLGPMTLTQSPAPTVRSTSSSRRAPSISTVTPAA